MSCELIQTAYPICAGEQFAEVVQLTGSNDFSTYAISARIGVGNWSEDLVAAWDAPAVEISPGVWQRNAAISSADTSAWPTGETALIQLALTQSGSPPIYSNKIEQPIEEAV